MEGGRGGGGAGARVGRGGGGRGLVGAEEGGELHGETMRELS